MSTSDLRTVEENFRTLILATSSSVRSPSHHDPITGGTSGTYDSPSSLKGIIKERIDQSMIRLEASRREVLQADADLLEIDRGMAVLVALIRKTGILL